MWDLDKTFGAIAEAGFDSVELMVTRDPRTQSADVPARLAGREGLDVKALHAPMLVITRSVWGPKFDKIIKTSTDVASKLGADTVIVHPPYIWETAYQRWLIKELDNFTAASGISIGIENMFRLWLGKRPVRGHRWVSPSDLDRFSQLTLDTSHCGVDGYDILEALDRIASQTVHIHLSDSFGNHRDNHALPGTGVLPLDEFVKRIPSSGFHGNLSLELDLRDQASDPKKVVEALTRAREFCEDRLA